MTACTEHLMVPAARVEVAVPRSRTVAVTACWSCGEESPALYERSIQQRNGMPMTDEERPCAHCERPFLAPKSHTEQRFCSQVCGARTQHAVNYATRRAS